MARLKLYHSICAALLVVSCGTLGNTHQQATAAPAPLERVTIAMGYIPNVQFAPFYVADAKGYYATVGLQVNFSYATAPDLIKLIGTGSAEFGNAEGDQVIVGAAHGLHVVSVLTQYLRFPVVVFSLKKSGITSFANLRGKSIGLPGFYGASYTGLLAALDRVHLSKSDVHLTAIGYTQVQEIALGRVDAAVGFAMNEPVQLRQQGYQVNVVPIADVVPLVGPGIITSQSLLQKQPSLVQRFVQATYRGLQDTNADPVAAFAQSRHYMPSISAKQTPYQLAVLREAVRYWTPSAGQHLGCATASDWKVTATTLQAQHQITGSIATSTLFTNRFVPNC